MSNDATDSLVTQTEHGPVLEISLNNAAAHNSLTVDMARALLDVLHSAAVQERVRCVLITAQGRSFCAGGDLGEMLAHQDDLAAYVSEAMRDAHNPLIKFIGEFPKPVVISVQGPAVGAGAGLALSGDITVMGESASLVLPFLSNLAIVPDAGCSWHLPRAMGAQKAMGQLISGQPIAAAQAVDEGLVWQCVSDDALAESSLKLAKQCARLSSAAIVRTRKLIRAAANQSLNNQLDQELELQSESFESGDVVEGINAFLERRRPEFQS